MSAEGKVAKVARGVLYALALLVVAFFLLLISARNVFLIQIPFHFVCGWAIHGCKALPPFFEKWQTAVLPVGCLLMAFVLAHRFIRRWVKEKRPMRDWRIRHTAAVFSLILFGSAAAIATSGIVHQFFWLAGGKVLYDNRKSEYIVAMGNGRQLMMALLEFQAEKGRYPTSFEELEIHAEEYPGMIRRLSWVDSRDRKVPEPWILLRPGSTDTGLGPVILSPLIAARGIVVVGYGDSTVRAMREDELEKVLGEDRIRESEGKR